MNGSGRDGVDGTQSIGRTEASGRSSGLVRSRNRITVPRIVARGRKAVKGSMQ